MTKKRIISALLLAAMLTTPILTACSETTQQDSPDTAPSGSDTSAAAGESESEGDETNLLAQIEKKDYNGYEFNYLALETGINGTTRFVDEMWVEEDSAEVILSATYNRNLFLAEQMNVNIAVTPVSNVAGTIRTSVSSGDNSYDMAGAYKPDSLTLALEGNVRDWNTLDIDYAQPWWSQGAVEKLRVQDYQFLMSGNILISEIDDTLAMVYNKDIGEEYNLEDVYSLVLENKWTIDRFMELTSAVSDDLDGNGEMDVGTDLFGYVQDPASMTNNWFFSSDLMNSYVDEDGAFHFNVDTERVQGMLDKLSPYFKTDNVYSGLDLYKGLVFFEEDKIYMYAIILRNVELLRNMESDFGVIPYPMYDEVQGRYLTHVGSASPILTIPLLNTEDDERLSDILEAMAISSRQYLLPAYYETALKEKMARDPETATMLDIIVDNKTYDITYLLGVGLINSASGLIKSGSTNFASSWAKTSSRNEKVAQKSFDKLIEAGKKQENLG